ncbi:hypothetical protein LPJ53_003340 [Coemansia erecta]|uniref:NudC domain-containing protein 1 n=1 Tax=Coemansia erecta TaxID=147472 RepID=A0A9W7Y1H7_9FUNG|nr:hypothetical protein LPJ53_003340 [Coemansia erecta]
MSYSILKFDTNSHLLNPKFEGYKLRLVDSSSDDGTSSAVQRYSLESAPVELHKLNVNVHLSFDEMYSRIHYNHLFVGPTDRSFVYVDSTSKVNLVMLDRQSGPHTYSIFEIPQAINPSALEGYPRVHCLDSTTMLVFDGIASVYVLVRNESEIDSEQWIAVGMFDIGLGSVVAGSADGAHRRRLHLILGATVVRHLDHSEICMHYCYRMEHETRSSSDTRSHPHPSFAIQAISVLVPGDSGSRDGHPIPILTSTDVHMLPSHAIPLYCEYLGDQFVIGVRDGIVLDETENPCTPSLPSVTVPDLYYWMQTDGDVTVCIQLPEAVSAHQIACEMTRSSLLLRFTNAPECESRFNFENTAFHSHIMADESVWTLEGGRLLTLYLEKARSGVRWSSVFSTDDGVLETIDPSEFATIREHLAKYTSETSSSGTRMLIQSAADAMDQDNDDLEQEDSSIVFSVRKWGTGEAISSSTAGSPDWLCPSFAKPPPHRRMGGQAEACSSAHAMLPSVCLKFDVDGIVYEIGADAAGAIGETHAGSFAALSYIQASKREQRFMYVDAEMTVAVLAETQRRIYIYHQSNGTSSTEAVQNIVDIGSGELFGMQITGRTLVLLRENSLYLVNLDRCRM